MKTASLYFIVFVATLIAIAVSYTPLGSLTPVFVAVLVVLVVLAVLVVASLLYSIAVYACFAVLDLLAHRLAR